MRVEVILTGDQFIANFALEQVMNVQTESIVIALLFP
jgi:hypothetical protein